jgi:hypothetical protein
MTPVTLTFDYHEALLVALALEQLSVAYRAAADRLAPTSSRNAIAELREQADKAAALLARVNEARR